MRWPRLVPTRKRAEAEDDARAARFRTLIMPHLDAAYGYARYLVRDGGAAEDIVQEAFLRALKAIDQCRGAPKAWLLTIVRNCFLDRAKAHGRHLSIDDQIEPIAPEMPDVTMERADTVLIVRQFIECLPEPFRGTIVLRELEEMTYREIAEVTDVPIGTVMSRLARARQMLAAMLVDDEATSKQGLGR